MSGPTRRSAPEHATLAKRFLFAIFTLLVAALVLGGVAEIGLRVARVIHRKEVRARFKKSMLCTVASSDPDLVWETKPNTCDFNGRGFRDFDYDLAKLPGVFRIVVIGDSIAAGQGVELDESFGKLLESALNRRLLSTTTFEVIVLARSGYATSQELVLLKKEAFTYHPDLILWSYTLNDPTHPVFHDASGGQGDYYYDPPLELFGLIRSKAFLLAERVRARACPDEFHARMQCIYHGEIAARLAKIGAEASRRGVPVLFAVHPVFEEKAFASYSLAGVHADLDALAEKSGLHTVDLLAAHEGLDARELCLKDGDRCDIWHPNPKGHAVVAESIFSHLRADRFFAPAERPLHYAVRVGEEESWKENPGENLDRFTGIYALRAGKRITVARRGDRLTAKTPSFGPFELVREGETRFSSQKAGGYCRFMLPPIGPAQRMNLVLGGKKSYARRLREQPSENRNKRLEKHTANGNNSEGNHE